MRHLLVFLGDEDEQHLREVVVFAQERGFILLSESSFEAGRLIEERPTLPQDYIEQWAVYLARVDPSITESAAIKRIGAVLGATGINHFSNLTSRTAMSVWQALRRHDISGVFSAIVETMRVLELRFVDWDLVSEGATDDMSISTHGKAALRRYGVTDIAFLRHLEDTDLQDMHQMGGRTIDAIKTILSG